MFLTYAFVVSMSSYYFFKKKLKRFADFLISGRMSECMMLLFCQNSSRYGIFDCYGKRGSKMYELHIFNRVSSVYKFINKIEAMYISRKCDQKTFKNKMKMCNCTFLIRKI